MRRIDHTIDVNVPVATAYNQWTQFESFPLFMEGVDRVVQLDDRTLEWTATIAGQTRTWRAQIVDQVPEKRIAWASTSGVRNDGIVTFRPLDADRTRISLAIEFEPEGAVENLGDALGVVEGRVKGDLERFRDFIESRGVETGAWRGRIRDDVAGDAPAAYRTEQERDPQHVASPTAARGRDEVATGRGFAEGLADPSLTRRPVAGPAGPETEADAEATGRGFAEGLADPALTRRPVADPVARRTTR